MQSSEGHGGLTDTESVCGGCCARTARETVQISPGCVDSSAIRISHLHAWNGMLVKQSSSDIRSNSSVPAVVQWSGKQRCVCGLTFHSASGLHVCAMSQAIGKGGSWFTVTYVIPHRRFEGFGAMHVKQVPSVHARRGFTASACQREAGVHITPGLGLRFTCVYDALTLYCSCALCVPTVQISSIYAV